MAKRDEFTGWIIPKAELQESRIRTLEEVSEEHSRLIAELRETVAGLTRRNTVQREH